MVHITVEEIARQLEEIWLLHSEQTRGQRDDYEWAKAFGRLKALVGLEIEARRQETAQQLRQCKEEIALLTERLIEWIEATEEEDPALKTAQCFADLQEHCEPQFITEELIGFDGTGESLFDAGNEVHCAFWNAATERVDDWYIERNTPDRSPGCTDEHEKENA